MAMVFGYYLTLIGHPMMEVEPTGQSGQMATKSGQNDN